MNKCYGCDKSEEKEILQICFFDGSAEQWSCEFCALDLDKASGMNGRLSLENQIYIHKGDVIYRGVNSKSWMDWDGVHLGDKPGSCT